MLALMARYFTLYVGFQKPVLLAAQLHARVSLLFSNSIKGPKIPVPPPGVIVQEASSLSLPHGTKMSCWI